MLLHGLWNFIENEEDLYIFANMNDLLDPDNETKLIGDSSVFWVENRWYLIDVSADILRLA